MEGDQLCWKLRDAITAASYPTTKVAASYLPRYTRAQKEVMKFIDGNLPLYTKLIFPRVETKLIPSKLIPPPRLGRFYKRGYPKYPLTATVKVVELIEDKRMSSIILISFTLGGFLYPYSIVS